MKLVIFYQTGTSAKQPSLIEQFKDLINATHTAPWDEVSCEYMVTTHSPDGSLETYLEMLTRTLQEFQAAIFFITYDARPASSAGNLWLELGCWLTKRGRQSLAIVLVEPPEESLRQQVQIIGDMVGHHLHKIKFDQHQTAEQQSKSLLEYLTPHITAWNRRDDVATIRIDGIKKALPGTSEWNTVHFAHCGVFGSPSSSPCSVREGALALIASLKLFHNVNRTVGRLMGSLADLSRKASLLLDVPTGRQPARHNVVTAFRETHDSAVQLTRDWAAGPGEATTAWKERLVEFTKTRGLEEPTKQDRLMVAVEELATDAYQRTAWYTDGECNRHDSQETKLHEAVVDLAFRITDLVLLDLRRHLDAKCREFEVAFEQQFGSTIRPKMIDPVSVTDRIESLLERLKSVDAAIRLGA